MNLGSIILGDLVTLAERGTYQGILILVWALAGAIGPTIVSLVCTEVSAHIELVNFRLVHWLRTRLGDGFSVSTILCFVDSAPHQVRCRSEHSSYRHRHDLGRLLPPTQGSRSRPALGSEADGLDVRSAHSFNTLVRLLTF